MKSFISTLFFAALASAQVIITNSNFEGIEAGEPFEITWDDATGPVTVTLKSGPSDNLVTVTTITSNAFGDSFIWTPSTSLPTGEYAFEITDGTTTNYSEQFGVEGGVSPSSSAASSSASVTSSASRTSSTVTASSTASSNSTTSSTESSSTASSTETSSSATTTGSSSTSTGSSTTTTSTRSSTSSAAPAQTTPPSNDAQGVVAPLVAPFLMAIGAALM